MKLQEIVQSKGQSLLSQITTSNDGDISIAVTRNDLVAYAEAAQWGDEVKASFNVNSSKFLKSIKGAPKIVPGSFCCFDCKNLTNEGLEGGPEKVGNFIAWNCGLTSYEGIPKIIGGTGSIGSFTGYLNLMGNPIKSLAGIGTYFKGGHVESINAPTSIEDSMLGLLKIPSLKYLVVMNDEDMKKPFIRAALIINKHLKGDRSIMDCQEELMDNGLEDYAKL